jgi:hypothetical protein
MPTTYRTTTSLSATGLANIISEAHAASGSMAGDSDIVDETQDIGTSSELVTLGEIAGGSAELVEFVNLDEAHFVSFSFENPCVAGVKSFKLKAGQSMMLCTPSGALYAIADTATVKILKRAVEA